MFFLSSQAHVPNAGADKSIPSYIMKQSKFPHVLLVALVASYLKYNLHANMNSQIYL